jgi:isoleucyl-tRNA synthetase
VLDRYLLAKTRQLIGDVTSELEALDSPTAAAKLRDFADVLTNWYVRRSRDRFWSGDDTAAFDTLYTVLETVARVAAPLLPLVTEELWRGLTGERSVHLQDWPDKNLFPDDDELVAAMDRAREIASVGLALRKAHGLRVRLPLAKVTVVGGEAGDAGAFADILRDELNVKTVEFQAGDAAGDGISQKLTVNARALGPRLGKQVQQVIQAAKAGDWSVTGEVVVVGGIQLEEGEFTLEQEASDPNAAIGFLDAGGYVVLDTHLTPELEAEGLARDVIRAVQDTRKAAGLDVSDRIHLSIAGDADRDIAALLAHESTIAAETLATETTFTFFAEPALAAAVTVPPGGQRLELAVGDYANTGSLVIDVNKSGAVDV